VVLIGAGANTSRKRVIELAGISSESCWMRVERYRANEALPRVPMRPYVRLCAPAAMTVCL
jgi:hypothetical protein